MEATTTVQTHKVGSELAEIVSGKQVTKFGWLSDNLPN